MAIAPLNTPPNRRRRSFGLRHLVIGTTLVLVASLAAVTPVTASPTTTGNPAVVSNWHALAVKTFLGDTTKAPVESFLYVGFVEAAVYNAVVGIDGRYEPYRFRARAPHGASDEAAAAAAAHRILVTYAPYATSTLNDAYAASLALIPDGEAKTNGMAFGELAAQTLIDQRVGDGRNAAILFTQPPGPGVWNPTPPAFASMAAPWLGFVTPLLVRSGAQFGLHRPPPALTSRQYTRDFNEVKELGSATSTTRTDEQLGIARFFSGNALVQYDTALRNQATVRQLDIVDSARMFAGVGMSMADTVISVWRAKYVYGYWRPITAIQKADTDDNSDTAVDTSWTPYLTTPNYPDYVSGYSGVTGAFSKALGDVFHTKQLQVTLISTAVPAVQRLYDSGRALNEDVISARVWLGIHFRFADTAGVDVGTRVADWALDHYFKRDGDDSHH